MREDARNRKLEIRSACRIPEEIHLDAGECDGRYIELAREQCAQADVEIDGLHDDGVALWETPRVPQTDVHDLKVHPRQHMEPQGIDLDLPTRVGLDELYQQRPEAVNGDEERSCRGND